MDRQIDEPTDRVYVLMDDRQTDRVSDLIKDRQTDTPSDTQTVNVQMREVDKDGWTDR